MAERATPRISSRKQPKQARSAQLVSDILTAAAQVLARDGALRFTTARVAEKAGVSIGSLYQYFPNKEAILFRLQFDEWQQTTGLIQGILTDTSLAPMDRVRKVIREFFRTECEEAEMRTALGDAQPFYRDAPESSEHRRAGRTTIVIAHRLSTVRDADLVVAMADGRAIETGTHATLLAAGGLYSRLVRLQASGVLA